MSITVDAKTWTLSAEADGWKRSFPPIDNIKPTKPVITATALSPSSISVALTTASTDDSGLDHYVLEVTLDGGDTFAVVDGNVKENQFPRTVIGLPASTQHGYRLRGIDASPQANQSDWSNVVYATTHAAGGTASVLPWPRLGAYLQGTSDLVSTAEMDRRAFNSKVIVFSPTKGSPTQIKTHMSGLKARRGDIQQGNYSNFNEWVVPNQFNGFPTAAGASSVTVTTGASSLSGRVYIVSGPGTGQWRTISGSTDNGATVTVNLSSPFSPAPTTASRLVITNVGAGNNRTIWDFIVENNYIAHSQYPQGATPNLIFGNNFAINFGSPRLADGLRFAAWFAKYVLDSSGLDAALAEWLMFDNARNVAFGAYDPNETGTSRSKGSFEMRANRIRALRAVTKFVRSRGKKAMFNGPQGWAEDFIDGVNDRVWFSGSPTAVSSTTTTLPSTVGITDAVGRLVVVSGAGAGSSVEITSFDNGTKTVTHEPWPGASPNTSSVVEIRPMEDICDGGILEVLIGNWNSRDGVFFYKANSDTDTPSNDRDTNPDNNASQYKGYPSGTDFLGVPPANGTMVRSEFSNGWDDGTQNKQKLKPYFDFFMAPGGEISAKENIIVQGLGPMPGDYTNASKHARYMFCATQVYTDFCHQHVDSFAVQLRGLPASRGAMAVLDEYQNGNGAYGQPVAGALGNSGYVQGPYQSGVYRRRFYNSALDEYTDVYWNPIDNGAQTVNFTDGPPGYDCYRLDAGDYGNQDPTTNSGALVTSSSSGSLSFTDRDGLVVKWRLP